VSGELGSDADAGARATEAVAAGLAVSSLLCWVSTAIVGSFRPQGLPAPYWQGLPWLRTDSLGILAFVVAALSLPVSEYLRLRRRRAAAASPDGGAAGGLGGKADGALVALAVSETVAVLSTGVVGYLSVNAVTHPQTLLLQVTHLAPGPSEGTLRVAGLILCFCSVSVARYLRALPARSLIPAGRPSGTPAGPGGSA
jgi:hypothetical protein